MNNHHYMSIENKFHGVITEHTNIVKIIDKKRKER